MGGWGVRERNRQTDIGDKRAVSLQVPDESRSEREGGGGREKNRQTDRGDKRAVLLQVPNEST